MNKNKLTNFDDWKKEQLKNPVIKKEYERLRPRYEVISQVVKFRAKKKLSQQKFAELTGIKQSNISRFENGDVEPSLSFLNKIANALGKELHITFK